MSWSALDFGATLAGDVVDVALGGMDRETAIPIMKQVTILTGGEPGALVHLVLPGGLGAPSGGEIVNMSGAIAHVHPGSSDQIYGYEIEEPSYLPPDHMMRIVFFDRGISPRPHVWYCYCVPIGRFPR